MFDFFQGGAALIISLVCGLFIVVFGLLIYGMYRNAQKDRDNFAKGVPAQATVVKVGSSSISRSYGTATINLLMEVTPPMGAVYQLMQVWDVDPASMDKVKVGQVIPIKIDARNPKRIYSVLPDVRNTNVDIDELFDEGEGEG